MARQVNLIINGNELVRFYGNEVRNLTLSQQELEQRINETMLLAAKAAEGYGNRTSSLVGKVHNKFQGNIKGHRDKIKGTTKLKTNRSKNVSLYAPANVNNHYDFFTSIGIEIFNDALAKGATEAGALYVVAQAANESKYGIISAKDYNLFNIKGRGSRRATDGGTFKDYSKIGGYEAAIGDYFNLINDTKHGYTGMSLIKKNQFTADDIDKAFNTGDYFPDKKALQKGIGSYGGATKLAAQNYGKNAFATFNTDKRLFGEALEYKLGLLTEEENQIRESIGAKEEKNSLGLVYDNSSLAMDIEKYSELSKEINSLSELRSRLAKINTANK